MQKTILIFFLLFVFACKDPLVREMIEDSNLIDSYLTERSPGMVQINDEIVIRFKNRYQIDSEQIEQAVRIQPQIKGQYSLPDDHTIIFKPEEHFEYDQEYSIGIDLGKIIELSPEVSERLILNFKTEPLRFNLVNCYYKLNAEGEQIMATIRGEIITSQMISGATIEQLLRIQPGLPELSVSWEHNEQGTVHNFEISGIEQQASDREIEVVFSGEPLPGDFVAERQFVIRGADQFSLEDVFVVNRPSRQINLIFSQPLNPNQDLQGMIRIDESDEDIRTQIDGNELTIYPRGDISGQFDLSLSKNIESFNGAILQESVEQSLMMEALRPQLRLANSGVIVPSGGQLTFPFEAVNIDTVDLEIFKIFDQNVLQFLQDNAMGGDYNLEQVGKIVLQEKVAIGPSSEFFNQWRSIALDLDEYFQADPDAIYQVRLGFRPSYVLIECPGQVDGYIPPAEGGSIMEYRFYDYGRWDDPCYRTYYSPDHFVQRNVLLSNASAIVKRTGDDTYHIAATAISDGRPLTNATVEFYNYQKMTLGSVSTDQNGLAVLKVGETAAFVTVRHAEGTSYINILDANSNSLSDFDTGGKKSKSGLDAFLYSDRGVYRPGDTIFMHLMLDDSKMNLPDDHPVALVFRDPQGVMKFSRNINTHEGRIYSFVIPTDQNDRTGIWNASVTIGGVNFSKRIRIETIKPNRLRLSLQQDPVIAYSSPNSRKIQIASSWLHGAPASNLRAQIDVQWSSVSPDFDQHKAFNFVDPARTVESGLVTIFNNTLDEKGTAEFELELDPNASYPAMLHGNVTSRAFEKGGDFSENYAQITVSPYDHYAGVNIPEDEWGIASVRIGDPFIVQAIVADENGKPTSDRELSVGIYDIDWQWWFYRGQRYRIYELNSAEHTEAIQRLTVTTESSGQVQIPINTDDLDYGRKLIRICDKASGHCTGGYFYASGWSSDISSDERNSLSRLNFQSDQPSYSVGDDVTLTIPSEEHSRILISIEGEDDILFQEWVDGRSGSISYTFRADEKMAPNVYAHISLVQPYGLQDNDLPIRMYGVIPVMVNDENKILRPQIIAPDQIEPETEFTITVQEEDGRDLVYTIAIVDEGLLDLTNFKTPDPSTYFYAKRSLGVTTWDLYDDILYGPKGTPDKIISIGGDGETGSGKGRKKAIRFKPVVFSAGPFRLGKNDRNTHSFHMPNYLGSVRAMVVARRSDSYGMAEQSATVKSPLMVLPTLPRVWSQGEKIKIPVSVFAMDESVRNVRVQLQSTRHLYVTEDVREVHFSQPGEQVVYFDATIGEELGVAKVEVIATSGTHESSQRVEIDVRNPNPVVTKDIRVTIQPGERKTIPFELAGVAGTNAGVLELSRIPSLNLSERVDYLVGYPYGCLEQTTSSSFVQLYLKDLTDYVSDEVIDRNIRAGIRRISKMRHRNGGFKYWPSSRADVHEWSSSYAGHFLIEARNKGYFVANHLLSKWAGHQRNLARKFSVDSDQNSYRIQQSLLNQAYRLYTLSLYGAPQLGAMNALRSEEKLSDTGKFLLAAAYAMNSKSNIALDLIRNAGVTVEPYRDLGRTFGSEVRDISLIAQALNLMDRQNQSLSLVKEIAEKLNSSQWYSTQSIAFGLLAVGKATEIFEDDEIKAEVNLESEVVQVHYNKPVFTMSFEPDDLNSRNVEVMNQSENVLFASIQSSGQPSAESSLSIEPVDQHISVDVRYKNLDGSRLDISRLQQGTDFYAEVEITNLNTRGTYLDEIALTQILPSGWEIRSGRLNQSDGVVQDSYDYRDVRDDRVLTFFDMGKRKKFAILLSAAYEGDYILPPVYVEAMYDKEVQATTKGQRVHVTGHNSSFLNQ